ncbi:hypothetical protein [Actinomycetospora cinnamomea]|uniref:Uncharacterized protein n=1 Tax=Actinomycetospora cinnamomea TaxID=663609 RepID=A0A2U1FR44_9PSEU|nr:hypothetical protein [Actinomycetospora cinnamomea]PVZ14619.1 hypothetical protein C8D89_101486 [Actinomycetospora cinnamomea]
MGAHRARQPSTVGKVAGRGAFTAAAALALTGGTASFAFADEPNFDATAHTTQTAVTDLAGDLEALPETEAPDSARDLEGLVGDHAASVEDKVTTIGERGAGDLEHTLNGAGVPVDSSITDGEEALSGAAGELSQQVHHATGSGAAALDEQAESFLSFA